MDTVSELEKMLTSERAKSSLLQDELEASARRILLLEKEAVRSNRRLESNTAVFEKLSSLKRELLASEQDLTFERGLRIRFELEVDALRQEVDALRSKNTTLTTFLESSLKETAEEETQTESATNESERGGDGARECVRGAAAELLNNLQRIQTCLNPQDARWLAYARSSIQCDANLYQVFLMLERHVRAKHLSLRTVGREPPA